MAEVKPRCRLYLQLPAQPSAKLEAQLAQALASADAACVLLCRDDAPTDESHAGRLLDLIQGRGVACLIEADARPAERLGTDGLHIAADDEAYRKARERLRYLEEAAAASTRAAELARLRYVEGGSDFLQVLDAERTMLERENERALGRTAAETGLIAVYRALGGANVKLPVPSLSSTSVWSSR